MKRLLLTLLLLPLFVVMHAQQTLLIGHVMDTDNQPISYASVYTKQDFTLTDEHGAFRLTLTAYADNIELNCTMLGYEPFIKEISPCDSIYLDIVLHDKSISMSEIVVTAPVHKIRGSGSWSNLSPVDIATSGGASGDIYRALQSTPGVQSQPESGKLLVRGGDSRETQTFIDDMHLPVAYTTSTNNAPSRGRFSPFIFDGINFTTGGYSAEYADALSSVLPLYTKDESNIAKIGINPSTIGMAGGGTSVFKNGSLSFNGDYMNLNPYFKVYTPNSELKKYPESVSGVSQLRVSPNDRTLLKVFASYDFTRFEQPLSALRENNVYLNSTFRHVTASDYNLFVGVAYGNLWDELSTLNSSSSEWHMKAKVSKRFSKHINVMLGVESYFRHYAIDMEELHQQVSPSLHSVFLISTISPFMGFNLDISARFDNKIFSPRMAASYSFSGWNISLAAGQYVQQPEYKYLFVNPLLAPERSIQAVAGLKYCANGRMLRFEGYWKDYKNLVHFNSNNGYGTSKGLDIYFSDEKSISNLEYRLGYSLNYSHRLYGNFTEAITPYYLSRHNVSAVVKYNCRPLRTLFSSTYTYASGRPLADGFTKPYNSWDLGATILATPRLIINCSVSNVLGTKHEFSSESGGIIRPAYDRFVYVGFFISLYGKTAYDVSNF